MPMPVLTVEFAPGDNWNVASPTWVNITAEVRNSPGFRIRRGRQTPFTRMRPSTLTLTLDNSTGNFDPDNSSGAYATDLVPMVPIRVRATHNAVTYDLYRGFVTSWTVGQKDFKDTFTTITAIDGLSLLQLYTLQSVYVQEVEADTPLAWYRLGESSGTVAKDSSGNAHHGTYIGPTLGVANDAILGDTDSAISFDGTNDYVSLPKGAFITSNPWTVEMWINLDTADPTEFMFTMGPRNEDSSDPDAQGYLEIRWVDGAPNDVLAYTITPAGETTEFTNYFDGPPNDGQWHHIAMTYASDGSISYYFDGAEIDTDSATASFTMERRDGIFLGIDNPFFDTFYYSGSLDEVAFYESELSAARILAHYNAAVAPWGAQLTSARVTSVLDAIGWPSADRTLSTGKSTMQNFLSGGSAALSAMFAAQDTEDSEAWVGGDGKVNFTNRHDRNVAAYAATFSNDTGGDSVYRDFVWVSDEQLLRNIGSVTDSDGAVIESRDSVSESTYAPRTVSRTSNTADATEIADYADWLPAEFGTARRRGLLTLLNGQTGTNDSWAEMLSRELGDLISVENTPVSGGAQNQYDLFVEEINLRGTVEAWTMSLGLSPAVRQRMFTLDRDPLGKLDRADQGLLGW